MKTPILALYDFASKQDYIYKTSKIKEISGASGILTNIYRLLTDRVNKENIRIAYRTDETFSLAGFYDSKIDGEVLYDGGGNLMVLYKSFDIYKKSNEIMSLYVMKHYPGLSMIISGIEITGNFKEDRAKLYKKNRINKNMHSHSDLCAVTPMTQIDPMTFQPVVHKDKISEISLSADRYIKSESYRKLPVNDLDNLEGMTAVIYIDGNSMGKKLMSLIHEDYDSGVLALREFSRKTNHAFVEEPLEKIQEYISQSEYKGYRRVIGGGDEITFICDARIAWKLIEVYFDTLEKSNESKSEDEKNYSCAGIAVFHAKSPFHIAYNIAEAACESAKSPAHQKNGNYVDFYFCHSAVTADFETLRKREQYITARPYEYHFAKEKFARYGNILSKAGRANVKALGTAIQKNKESYLMEVSRINAYLGSTMDFRADMENLEQEMGIIYDMAEFYDIWFAGKEEKFEKEFAAR